MKAVKLIKTFPSCAFKFGDTFIFDEDQKVYRRAGSAGYFKEESVEDYPEFWQKVDVPSDVEHLLWCYERLLRKHGESANVDYMIRFKEIIERLL